MEELVEVVGGVKKTDFTSCYGAANIFVCQLESGGSHTGGGMTQCAPTLFFHRQW